MSKGQKEKLSELIYDGYTVYHGMDDKAKRRTTAESVSDVLDSLDRLSKAARQQAPAEHAEPVAMMLIDEPELTTQGWEHGDFDIEWTKAAEAFAQSAAPGAYALYAAPVDQSEQIVTDNSKALAAALERIAELERELHDVLTCNRDEATGLLLVNECDEQGIRQVLAKHGEASHD